MRQVKLLGCSLGSNPTVAWGYLLGLFCVCFVMRLCLKSVAYYASFGILVVALQSWIAF